MYYYFPMKIFNWSAEKNQLLMNERGVSFEEILFFLRNGGLLDDLEHPNSGSYANQQVFIVAMNDYVYYVPYVETQDEIFLKTIIPSRKLTKRYLGGQTS